MADKFFFVKGGAERYYFELMGILESHGHTVIPFSMKHPQNEASLYSDYFVDFIDFRSTGKRDRARKALKSAARVVYSFHAKRNLERLIRKTRPDIAHLHMIDHQISPSILPVLKRAGIPVVQTLHTYKAICPNYRFFVMHEKRICEKCLHGAYYHPVIERCHQRSALSGGLLAVEAYVHALLRTYRRCIDLFIAPSAFMGRKMVEGGYPPERIRHLPYTIRLEDYPVRYGSDGYFVFYGRLSEEKGVATLLRAMRGIGRSRLKIIGDGPERAALQKLAEDLKLTNVEFTGSLKGRALQQGVLGAQFVVVPSEWYENSPLVIYEAFTMGKPVIGSRIGGIPELVGEGQDGLLFNPGDATELHECIQTLLRRPRSSIRMGKRARQKAVAWFDPEKHYHEIMGIYQSLRR